MGGVVAVDALTSRFLHHLHHDPDVADLRAEHQRFDAARFTERFPAFFRLWFGVDEAYSQQFGPPRLRARHDGVRMDSVVLHDWLRCMGRALDDVVVDEALREEMRAFFHGVALHAVEAFATPSDS